MSSSLKVSHPCNNVANCTLQKGGILPCTRARFNQYISASPSSSRLACQLLQLPVAVTIPPSPHPLHRGGKDGEMIYFCRLEPVAFGCNRLQVDIAGAFACAHYCLQGLFFFCVAIPSFAIHIPSELRGTVRNGVASFNPFICGDFSEDFPQCRQPSFDGIH